MADIIFDLKKKMTNHMLLDKQASCTDTCIKTSLFVLLKNVLILIVMYI